MVIYGGVDIKAQKEALKTKPPHIVVGTPGRLKSVRGAARGAGGRNGLLLRARVLSWRALCCPCAEPRHASLCSRSCPRTAT